jgi:hypothetical protein
MEDTKTISFVGRTRREGEDARFRIHPRSGVWDPSRARSWGSHTDGDFTFGLLFCIYRLEILLVFTRCGGNSTTQLIKSHGTGEMSCVSSQTLHISVTTLEDLEQCVYVKISSLHHIHANTSKWSRSTACPDTSPNPHYPLIPNQNQSPPPIPGPMR